MSKELVTAFAAGSNGQQAEHTDKQQEGCFESCGRFPVTASPDELTGFSAWPPCRPSSPATASPDAKDY
jgi:hypothetical protein